MRTLNYKTEYQKLLSPEIISYLAPIHEQKCQQNLFIEAHKDALSELLEIAKIQSTEASNRIEGIITTDDRLKKIVMNKTTPKGRSEREIAGYRDVLNTIHENYDFIPVRPGMILQLHRDLYKFSNSAIGGSFKNSDNIIAEELPDGTKRVRFQPVPAWETSEAMDSLCSALQEALTDPEMDPLLLIPMFILDFLCIHPFRDGNGRMSRLLSLLLLYKNGYDAGKYVSFEEQINKYKAFYYEALKQSSDGWADNQNTYFPFIENFLSTLYMCYKELDKRFAVVHGTKITKKARIEATVLNSLTPLSKAEICQILPDVSPTTVEAVLGAMVKDGSIKRIGSARASRYIKA